VCSSSSDRQADCIEDDRAKPTRRRSPAHNVDCTHRFSCTWSRGAICRVAGFFFRWMLNLWSGRKCRPCTKVRGKLANHGYWSREEWIELVRWQWKTRMKANDFSETSGQTVCKFRILPIFPHFLRCCAVVGD